MNTTVAAALAAAAVLGVWLYTQKQEAAAAMRARQIISSKAGAPLTGGDAAAGIAAGVATYFGGAAAGRTTLNLFGRRL